MKNTVKYPTVIQLYTALQNSTDHPILPPYFCHLAPFSKNLLVKDLRKGEKTYPEEWWIGMEISVWGTAKNVSLDTRIQGILEWRVQGNWHPRDPSERSIRARDEFRWISCGPVASDQPSRVTLFSRIQGSSAGIEEEHSGLKKKRGGLQWYNNRLQCTYPHDQHQRETPSIRVHPDRRRWWGAIHMMRWVKMVGRLKMLETHTIFDRCRAMCLDGCTSK